MFIPRKMLRSHVRNVAKYLHKDKTAKEIRKRFLDFFINENGHNFIRSSPVVPYCDPSVAFVNAGMNQFKNILIGKQAPLFKKVANSQKCIRVGGKHNDLDIIGTDGYHHTFFEMLGNWSFGEYFKKEACSFAWKLLTDIYKIPPSRLYVTYFKGSDELSLKEDLETKEIWKMLGVPENRILPFGSKENFWEMGPIGPCGPCTEIHVDHIGTSNRATFVNRGLFDLTELWNIVFIQYNRNPDGSLSQLPTYHIDTGLGFERLTAVLQGKISNYDTDNFNYLINAIHKICRVPPYTGCFGEKDWNALDSAYRILSDHSRMITICLADGMIPEQNQKLRRIIRKSLLLSETSFKRDKGLLKELSNYIAENLGVVYTEIEKNISQIHQILDYEEEVFKQLRTSACEEWNKLVGNNENLLALDIIEFPSLIGAYKEILRRSSNKVDGELGFKLYDTFGLDEQVIVKLSKALNLPFDKESFREELNKIKLKSKSISNLPMDSVVHKLEKMKVKKTDDSSKYDYTKIDNNEYKFNNLNIQVLKILQDDQIVPEICGDSYCSLILDKTNMYSTAGGQVSDKGTIAFSKSSFEISDTENHNGYILHKGYLKCNPSFKLKPNIKGVISLHPKYRLNVMRNHTCTHLLNSVIKKLKGATCQKSSNVTELYLNIDLAIFGEKLKIEDCGEIEAFINDLIKKDLKVNVRHVNSQELSNTDDVTVIPGEIYPESNIRLIEINSNSNFISREPCCGTHVYYTSDIQDFALIGLKSLGKSTMSLYAVTAERAELARKNGENILDDIITLEKSINDNIDKPEVLETAVTTIKHRLNFNFESESIVPVIMKHKCLEKLNHISKKIKDTVKGNFREFIDMEMQNVLQSNMEKTSNNQPFVVHYLRSSMLLQSVPLQKATKLCPDVPILIVSFSDGVVKARCCVPKELTSEGFNAEKWLKLTVADVFKSSVAPPKGQDGKLVCNMKAKKVSIQDWDPLLSESLDAARNFIKKKL